VQRQALGDVEPADLGQPRSERVAAVELVGPIRREHQDRLGAQVADDVGEQVAARAVGPVEVLDHEQQWRLGGDAQQVRQDGLEQAGPGQRLVTRGRQRVRQAEARHQATKLGARRRGESFERRGVVVSAVVRCGEGSEELGERRVGQAATSDRDATAERAHPLVGRLRQVLAEEAGLADARVAANEEEMRLALRCLLPGRLQLLELGLASDEREVCVARHVLDDSHPMPAFWAEVLSHVASRPDPVRSSLRFEQPNALRFSDRSPTRRP